MQRNLYSSGTTSIPHEEGGRERDREGRKEFGRWEENEHASTQGRHLNIFWAPCGSDRTQDHNVNVGFLPHYMLAQKLSLLEKTDVETPAQQYNKECRQRPSNQ